MSSSPFPPVRQAMLSRRSAPKVTDEAPSSEELIELVEAAGRVADHAGLRPWRIIEIRGDDRYRLGEAFGRATRSEPSVKPLRAPLMVAIVASVQPNKKVPEWEQDVVAAGVGHALSLLLDEAGYGVMWRTGDLTRHPEVAKVHGLADNEKLLGWLYVGGRLVPARPGGGKPLNGGEFVSRLP